MADGRSILGVVIAGGRSTRFGGEKGAALLGGVPLVIRAAHRLQAACPTTAVNALAGSQAEALAVAEGLQVLHDAPGDPDGPLAGVRAGLTWAKARGADGVAVSPCDTPFLPDDLFHRLLQAAGGGAAMAETAEGPQPLAAVWPIAALPVLDAALKDGRHPSVWQVLDAVGAARVRFEDAQAFANLNTPADLAAAAARLGY